MASVLGVDFLATASKREKQPFNNYKHACCKNIMLCALNCTVKQTNCLMFQINHADPDSCNQSDVLLSPLGLGKGDGSDWRFEIFLAADQIFECSLDSPNEKIVSFFISLLSMVWLICLFLPQSRVGFDRSTNTLEIVFDPSKPVVLIDDVKFKFYSTNVSA